MTNGVNTKEKVKIKNSKQHNKAEALEALRSNFFASLNISEIRDVTNLFVVTSP